MSCLIKMLESVSAPALTCLCVHVFPAYARARVCACVGTARVAVSNAFFFELEYQQTGAYTHMRQDKKLSS